MEARSNLPTYDLFADLVDAYCEGNDIVVLRVRKRNQPYLSVGELKKHFLGWQIALTFRKIRRVWSE